LSKEIGVGIFGYSIGKSHAFGWTEFPKYYFPPKLTPRLVALGGRNQENVRLEANRFGFERTYPNWEDLVRDKEVEIFDNCGPPALHPEPTMLAAELGKNVVCEKPLARNGGEENAGCGGKGTRQAHDRF
jgi:predicted dehydrogenase